MKSSILRIPVIIAICILIMSCTPSVYYVIKNSSDYTVNITISIKDEYAINDNKNITFDLKKGEEKILAFRWQVLLNNGFGPEKQYDLSNKSFFEIFNKLYIKKDNQNLTDKDFENKKILYRRDGLTSHAFILVIE